MTSPYATTLLQETVEPARRHAPVEHQRSVTHVVAPQQMAAPMMQQPQPQVVYVTAPAARGGAMAALVLGLIVILLGAAALVGGYLVTRSSSPTADEAALVSGVASREAYLAGRDRAIDAGRQQALENAGSTTALRAAIARNEAYAKAFARGEKAGRSSYRRPTYSGYSGYRSPRYSSGGFGGYQVAQAFGQAQNLANITGAPVDVEIY
ncbi:MAG: hypothetical protein JWM86_725 [Thermoleophilia bacterium]|nr:hypothetical protein [Thermoleophilia bacterium]